MGWIGVDLDGTLAEYGGWKGEQHIGEPVPAMAARVRRWIAEGKDVRIFTARVAAAGAVILGGWESSVENKARLSVDDIRNIVQDWTLKHFGVRLPVTNVKDFAMHELWDDRCVQIEPNTGRRMDGGE